MSKFLSRQERLVLEQELALERNARYSDRIKCILLLDSGKSAESIAEYLFLSLNSIAKMVFDDYRGKEFRLNER